MALGKKGIFFTLISILLVTLVIASFTFYSTYRSKSNMYVVETRVNTMERFIEDLEKDIERAVYIAGFRAILGIEDYIIAEGLYVDDAESAIEELTLNGTFNGNVFELTADSSVDDWFERAKVQAQNIGLDMNYEIIDFQVSQSSPWLIDFFIEININITDERGIAQWTRTKNASKTVSIMGMEDIVYTIEAFGRTARMINQTSDNEIDGIDELKDFIDSKKYRAYSGAPSFLMRLEGNLSSSPYGIETIVNTNELAYYELTVLERSSVDYIYFGEQSTTDYMIHNITDDNMPYFRLDEEHVNDFNVANYTY